MIDRSVNPYLLEINPSPWQDIMRLNNTRHQGLPSGPWISNDSNLPLQLSGPRKTVRSVMGECVIQVDVTLALVYY